MASPQRENRPPTNNRQSTAPSVMTVNGHFAGVGEIPTKSAYEHGIQVIDEDQNFKYVLTHSYPHVEEADFVAVATAYLPT